MTEVSTELPTKTQFLLTQELKERAKTIRGSKFKEITTQYLEKYIRPPGKEKDLTSTTAILSGETADRFAKLHKLQNTQSVLSVEISRDDFDESVRIARGVEALANIVGNQEVMAFINTRSSESKITPEQKLIFIRATEAMKTLLYEAYKDGKFGTGSPQEKRQEASNYYQLIRTEIRTLYGQNINEESWNLNVDNPIISEFEAMTAVYEEFNDQGLEFFIRSANEKEEAQATDFVADIIHIKEGKRIREQRRYQVKKKLFSISEDKDNPHFYVGNNSQIEIPSQMITQGRNPAEIATSSTRLQISFTKFFSRLGYDIDIKNFSSVRLTDVSNSEKNVDVTPENFWELARAIDVLNELKFLNSIVQDDINNGTTLISDRRWQPDIPITEYSQGWIFILKPRRNKS